MPFVFLCCPILKFRLVSPHVHQLSLRHPRVYILSHLSHGADEQVQNCHVCCHVLSTASPLNGFIAWCSRSVLPETHRSLLRSTHDHSTKLDFEGHLLVSMQCCCDSCFLSFLPVTLIRQHVRATEFGKNIMIRRFVHDPCLRTSIVQLVCDLPLIVLIRQHVQKCTAQKFTSSQIMFFVWVCRQ